MFNATGLRSLPELAFSGLDIGTIVIEANRELGSLENNTFSGLLGLRNLTIRRNLQLRWPLSGNALFYSFSDADSLKVLDLEANNITFKGEVWDKVQLLVTTRCIFRHSVKGGNRNSLQYKRNIAAIGTFKVCSNKCGLVKKYNKVSRKND